MDKRLLKNYYKSIGYYDVQIISNSVELEDDKNLVVLNYNIDAGNQDIGFQRYLQILTRQLIKKHLLTLSTQYEKIIGDTTLHLRLKKF